MRYEPVPTESEAAVVTMVLLFYTQMYSAMMYTLRTGDYERLILLDCAFSQW
jgi:hypothetical protein